MKIGKVEVEEGLLRETFMRHVAQGPGCWMFTKIGAGGYGYFSIGRYSPFRAHRVSYMLFKGPIPEGKMVLHRCDVRNCVNPDHLHIGTQQDNMRDGVDRGRFPRGINHWSHVHPELRLSGSRHGMWRNYERAAYGDRNGQRTHPEKTARGDRHGSKTHPERWAHRARPNLGVMPEGA